MPKNKTSKLDKVLERRIALAQLATNTKSFSDFARRSYTRECRETERELRDKNPSEYKKIYGGEPYYDPPTQPATRP